MCDHTVNLTDEYSFDYFINYKWDYDRDRDPIVCYNEYKDLLDKKNKKVLYSGFVFLTLSPDHLNRKIEFSDENIRHLMDFCKAQFNEFNYSYYNWVIEGGKKEDDPACLSMRMLRCKHCSRISMRSVNESGDWEIAI